MAVHAVWNGGMKCLNSIPESDISVLGDEPVELGGEGHGPNPFALLQMSLASCTIVTILGVAHEKGIGVRGVEVDVKHKQNMAVSGPNDPRQRELKITALRRTIHLEGDLSDEQRAALLWGANHCPVSNTLEEAIDIETSLEVVGQPTRG